MTDPKLSEMSADEFAGMLRAGYRAIIMEADEWRPAGEHIKAIVALARTERDTEVRRVLREVEELLGARAVADEDLAHGAETACNEARRRLFPGEKT